MTSLQYLYNTYTYVHRIGLRLSLNSRRCFNRKLIFSWMGRLPRRGYLGDAGSDGADTGGALTRLGGVREIDWREPCDLRTDSIGG